MPSENPLLEKMERQHRAFWEARTARRSKQMDDVGLRTTAFRFLEEEQLRVPIRFRRTLEQALDDAEECRKLLIPAGDIEIHRPDSQTAVEIGRKGGQAKKSDPLQELIIAIVAKKPRITCKELLIELRADFDARNVIQDIDETTIYFENRSEKTKQAPISGLKDRLARVRKSRQSR